MRITDEHDERRGFDGVNMWTALDITAMSGRWTVARQIPRVCSGHHRSAAAAPDCRQDSKDGHPSRECSSR
jgi:hypothetical protein